MIEHPSLSISASNVNSGVKSSNVLSVDVYALYLVSVSDSAVGPT